MTPSATVMVNCPGAAQGSGKGGVQLAVRHDRCRAGNGSHRAAGKGDCGGGFGRCPIVARSDDQSVKPGTPGSTSTAKVPSVAGLPAGVTREVPSGLMLVVAVRLPGPASDSISLAVRARFQSPASSSFPLKCLFWALLTFPMVTGSAVLRRLPLTEKCVRRARRWRRFATRFRRKSWRGGSIPGWERSAPSMLVATMVVVPTHPDPALGSSGIDHAHAEGMIGYVRSGGLADNAVVPGVVAVNPGRNGELVLSANLAVEVSEKNLVVGPIKLIGAGPARRSVVSWAGS